MTPIRSTLLRPALLVLVAACAGRTPAATHVPPDRSIITQDELLQNRFNNLYDGILALRPAWLETHGTNSLSTTPTQIQVYLDNNRLGGIETLRMISLGSVVYVRHYDGIAATARWGLDHGQGVIYVSTHLEGSIGP